MAKRTTKKRSTTVKHSIIPQPQSMKVLPGEFQLDSDTYITADALSRNTAKYLSSALADGTGFRVPVLAAGSAPEFGAIISFQMDPALADLGEEGYTLVIQPDCIQIQASHPAGLFYACQTLLQLLPREILKKSALSRIRWVIPCMTIKDQPQFPWRGLMLDVARHFHTKSFIKRYIDLLAFYKMNRLHLHLTDGQAWTLQIRHYPRLADRRKIPPHTNPARGVYSQKDIREIVRYAASRHVMIIPEIEFPCHSDAILDCYPELMCVNHPSRTGGQGHKEYCPGRDDVYAFIKNVLTEVAELFDAPYIHIGGDEYFGTAWENCPDCQKRIKREKLGAGDSPKLQALFRNCQGSPRKYLLYRYMMRRIAKQVVSLKRIPILWDDLSWRGEFPEKTVFIQWHYKGLFDWMQQVDAPDDPAREAALAGHPVITAPASHLYFDYFNGGKLIQRVYEFEPVPHGLKAEQAKYVLGPQACMWEHAQEKIDGMLFPRLIALAEQAWTSKRLRKWAEFSARLDQHYPRLKILGVQYTKPVTLPKIGESRPVGSWDIPKMGGGLKEWLINDVVTGRGQYELTLKLKSGRTADPIIRALWTDDGHEMPTVPIKTKGNLWVYRFMIPSVKLQGLYSARLYLKGDGRSDSCGEGFLKRIR